MTTDYKYLGLTVTHGKKKILRTARDTVEKQIKQLGSAVNGCVQYIRESAYKVFVRSRLTYQMVHWWLQAWSTLKEFWSIRNSF